MDKHLVSEGMFGFDTWPWRQWAAMAPNAKAIDGDTPLTWGELAALVDGQQARLGEAPIVVLDSALSQRALIVGMLAAWQAGKKTLVLNQALSDEVQATVLSQLGVYQFLPDRSREPDVNVLPTMSHWQPDQPLTLTLTSGSTGTPKVIAHAAHQHLASAAGLTQMLPFLGLADKTTSLENRVDRWLLSLPLFHISGLAIVWRWLYKGAQLAIYPCRGESMASALTHVSHASLVPTQLYRVLPSLRQCPDTSTLSHVLLGGAAISSALTEQAEQQGVSCWCGYGMTETASTVTLKRADGQDDVGTILPYRDLMVADDGEVIHRGETLALGVWQAGALHQIDASTGLASRDVASWCTDVQPPTLRIIGRKDNQFICGGENVQPEVIEAHLQQCAEIRQAMVVPIDDREFGARPLAIIQSRGHLNAQQLADYCRRLPAYQRPVAFLPWPSLSPEAGIKPSRALLTQWAQRQAID
ncbi:AMP-binding protein [Salinivibrio sp. ML323]|uniref:AMP-binding protein n=1 Tax=Salinivibrio sp. ML323 TaxID=1909474 RepID=UPI0013011AB9|nr:AMP-binding protein [Salinivibrio sp. ML323]